MTPELLQRLSAPVPRYTSYPTANHFSDRVQAKDYTGWLTQLPEASVLSLYLHFPFCRELCWYCACNTRAVRRYAPIAAYLDSLEDEMARVAAQLMAKDVAHIHWGGGSPDALTAADIRRAGHSVRRLFRIRNDAEIAVEIDPRLLEANQVAAFAAIGVNRISLGVQDFAPEVQAAIGRQQSFEVTRDAVEAFRRHGVASVNVDLVYGLPYQTLASATQTIERVIELSPDRVAVFGYAHLPQRMKHQRLIDSATLPGPQLRLELSRKIGSLLEVAGYRPVGIDHFAKPGDALAGPHLARNFQGYTTDRADALIGFGASAISQLPQGYAQNATGTNEYQRRLRDGGLATARGIGLSNDDRVRAYVIERLMCDFTFNREEIKARFGSAAETVVAAAERVCAGDRHALVEPTAGGFRIVDSGRQLVRTICAEFDSYLGTSEARHAQAV